MRYVALSLLSALALAAQALPTLPAVVSITTATEICRIEVQDAAGGLFTQCQAASDGATTYTAVTIPSEDGAILGHGPIMCLYWSEDPGKHRLQCGDTVRVTHDGYVPTVTRKRRWYLFWR